MIYVFCGKIWQSSHWSFISYSNIHIFVHMIYVLRKFQYLNNFWMTNDMTVILYHKIHIWYKYLLLKYDGYLICSSKVIQIFRFVSYRHHIKRNFFLIFILSSYIRHLETLKFEISCQSDILFMSYCILKFSLIISPHIKENFKMQ